MDETKEEELPEGFRVTDGTDDTDAVDVVDAVDPIDETEEPAEDQFDIAFGKSNPLFPEGDEEAKEFLDMFAQKYEE